MEKIFLAIYPETQALKVALFSLDKGQPSLELLRSFPKETSQGELVKPLDILQPILAGKKVVIVSGLDAREVLFREVTLPLTRYSALRAALPFQCEALFPHPLEQLLVVPLFHKEKTSTRISLFATTHTALQNHLENLALHGIDPDSVSAAPMALLRHLNFCKELPDYAFYFGEQNSFFLALSKEKKMPIVRAHVYPKALRDPKDLDRICTYLKQAHPPQNEPAEWTWGGETPSLGELEKSIKATQNGDFAIPIGLALDALYHDTISLQFRTGPFIAPHQQKKRKRHMMTFAVTALFALGATWGSAFLWIHHKEREILNIYSTHFSPIKNRASLLEELHKLEKTFSKQTSLPSSALIAPKVSSFLHWVSTHPVFTKKEQEIDIISLHYSLVKYPKLGETKEPYQVKIELKFTTPVSRAAKEVHDALLSEKRIIDTKQEISWKAQEHFYTSSFYLKNVH